jgi:hypothetical protein
MAQASAGPSQGHASTVARHAPDSTYARAALTPAPAWRASWWITKAAGAMITSATVATDSVADTVGLGMRRQMALWMG